MRVLQVNNYAHVRGGSDAYFIRLSKVLAQRGHDVSVLSTADEHNNIIPGEHMFVHPNDATNPGPVDVSRYLFNRRARGDVSRFLEGRRLDVAHLHIYYGQLTTAILRPLREAKIPIVQTLHDHKLACPVQTMIYRGAFCDDCASGAFWHCLQKRCNRGSLMRTAVTMTEAYVARRAGDMKIDHFMAASEYLREKMIGAGVPSDKITTVHNCVDTVRFRPQFDVGDYILYLGRIERLKGVFTLIDAVAALGDIPTVLVGIGEAMSEVQREVSVRGLKHVHLLGFRDGRDLRDLIRKSRFVVLPSEYNEICPLSVLEAFASGKPVIGSMNGGIPELIEDGVDGCLFRAGNAEELQGRIVGLTRQPHLIEEMGRRARRKVEERFGVDAHYGRVLDVYKRVS